MVEYTEEKLKELIKKQSDKVDQLLAEMKHYPIGSNEAFYQDLKFEKAIIKRQSLERKLEKLEILNQRI